MIKIRQMDGGIVIPIRVQPNSSQEKVIGEYSEQLKIAVNAPPERGKANKAIVKVLAKWIKIKDADIYLLHGEKSKDKEVFVKNITEKDIHKLMKKSTSSVKAGKS